MSKRKRPKKCPWLAKIRRLASTDNVIPSTMLEHANQHKECLFWLSHYLALRLVLFNNTLIKNNDECLTKREFVYLLEASARAIEKTGELPCRIEEIPSYAIKEASVFGADIIEHLHNCPLCYHYYEITSKEMLAAQKIYEKDIGAMAKIRPVVEDKTGETIFSWRNHKLPPQQKPC